MRPETYYKRKELGLCPICGKENDRDDRIGCTECLKKRSTYQAQYYAKMTDEEKTERLRYMREYLRTRRAELRAQGRCAMCGMPSPETFTCAACRQRAKELRDRRKQLKNEQK